MSNEPDPPAKPAVLAYATLVDRGPAGRWSLRLSPFRYLLLGLYVAGLAGACYAIANREPFGLLHDLEFPAPLVIGGLIVLFFLQAAFLTGAPHWRWPRPTGRRSMRLSLAAAGVVAALLSLGFAGTFVSLIRAEGLVGRWDDAIRQTMGEPGADLPWVIILFIVIGWAGWFVLFLLLWAARPIGIFLNVYRLLFAGSILEVLVTIPVDAQVRRRTSCYCGEGTFVAVVVGVTTAFWAFGPGIVLLFLTRRLQRRAQLRVCTGCGYHPRGPAEPYCPRCGKAFDPVPVVEPAGPGQ